MKILLVKPSSLGDIIHALPVAGALARNKPGCQIHWLANDQYADLIRCCPFVAEVIEFRRRRWVYPAAWGELPAFVSRLRRDHYHWAIDLQGLLRSGLLTGLVRADRKIGLQDAREGAGFFYRETVRWTETKLHAVDRYLKVMDHLGLEKGPVRFPLEIRREIFATVAARESIPLGEPFVAINPFSRGAGKRWRLDGFRELMGKLPGTRFIVLGEPADRPEADELVAGMPTSVNLAGRTTLIELAAVLQAAQILVTNDSGPMHLAVALGTPVVALFGRSDPALTGPYGGGPQDVFRFPESEAHGWFRPGRDTGSPSFLEKLAARVGEILGHAQSSNRDRAGAALDRDRL